jgi:hypothetical protein
MLSDWIIQYQEGLGEQMEITNRKPNRKFSSLEVSDRKVLAWHIHDQTHHIKNERRFKLTVRYEISLLSQIYGQAW